MDKSKDAALSPSMWINKFIGVTYRGMGEGLLIGAEITGLMAHKSWNSEARHTTHRQLGSVAFCLFSAIHLV